MKEEEERETCTDMATDGREGFEGKGDAVAQRDAAGPRQFKMEKICGSMGEHALNELRENSMTTFAQESTHLNVLYSFMIITSNTISILF